MIAIEEGLIADIIENPDDDTPRLIYADWLEDEGRRERAEFIRIQLLLAKRPGCRPMLDLGPRKGFCGQCSYCHLRDQLLSIWHYVSLAYTAAACESINPVPEQWRHTSLDTTLFWSRGFVESLTCQWEWWEKHHREITQHQPVTKVYLQNVPVGVRREYPEGRPNYSFGGIGTLTLEVPANVTDLSEEIQERAALYQWLARRWPKIGFELPPPEAA